MAVKMRLMRTGKTKSPHYRVVVIDGRAPRDGRYIDQIGRYDPRQDPSLIEIDAEKAVDWLRKGAQPTEAVAKLLDVAGALTEFKVKAGRIHTVGSSAPAEKSPAEEDEATPVEEKAAPARPAPAEEEPAAAVNEEAEEETPTDQESLESEAEAEASEEE